MKAVEIQTAPSSEIKALIISKQSKVITLLGMKP